MTSTKKDPVLAVLQLSGGNDALNTIVPYADPLYSDNRPSVRVSEDQVLKIDDHIGFNPALGPIKDLFDQGKLAIILGVGYPNPNRSHFRSMDIWHTCEPEKVGSEGWLGKAVKGLASASPTSLALTWKHLQRSQRDSLKQVLDNELVMSVNCLKKGEFAEGIRALLIDKDMQPRWRYASLAELDNEWIEEFFSQAPGH